MRVDSAEPDGAEDASSLAAPTEIHQRSRAAGADMIESPHGAFAEDTGTQEG